MTDSLRSRLNRVKGAKSELRNKLGNAKAKRTKATKRVAEVC